MGIQELETLLLKAAVWILKNRPETGLLYIHTTDYPMHMWPPESAESKRHLAVLDGLFGELEAAAPDAASEEEKFKQYKAQGLSDGEASFAAQMKIPS